MTHTDIRLTLPVYSGHDYKGSFGVERSVIINYCVILRCNTNTSIYLLTLTYVYIHVHIHLGFYIYTYECQYVCMYVCMYVSM